MNRAAQSLKALMEHVKGFCGEKAAVPYNRLQMGPK